MKLNLTNLIESYQRRILFTDSVNDRNTFLIIRFIRISLLNRKLAIKITRRKKRKFNVRRRKIKNNYKKTNVTSFNDINANANLYKSLRNSMFY